MKAIIIVIALILIIIIVDVPAGFVILGFIGQINWRTIYMYPLRLKPRLAL